MAGCCIIATPLGEFEVELAQTHSRCDYLHGDGVGSEIDEWSMTQRLGLFCNGGESCTGSEVSGHVQCFGAPEEHSPIGDTFGGRSGR